MVFGRFLGWALVLAAFLMASAEAVAALGTGEYVGIAACDVITLITGLEPHAQTFFAGRLMLAPAWMFAGSLGVALVFACRNKKHRSTFS